MHRDCRAAVLALLLCMLGNAACLAGQAVAPAATSAAGHDAGPRTRAQWAAELAWPTRLCPAAKPRFSGEGVDVQRIDANRSWIVVVCEEWTTQGTQIVYLRTPQHTTLLRFMQFDASGAGPVKRYQSALLTGSIEFDAEHAALRVLRAYRGIGDCGQYLQYAAGTASVRLSSLRLRECPDTPGPDLPPAEWPLRKL